MKYYCCFCLIIFLVSCKNLSREKLNNITLLDNNNKSVEVEKLTGNKSALFLFMSPDCPLCINYTSTINDLYMEFSQKDIEFIIIYPGYFEREEITKFQQTYNFKIQGYTDPDLDLIKYLDATVTPQAILISTDGSKIYSGSIDDRMVETGRKRTVISHHYLKDAITWKLAGKTPVITYTEPVGCFIEL